MRVETELDGEELRDFDRGENASEEEYHGVRGGRDEDRDMNDICQRLEEVPQPERSRINAAEGHVLLFKVGTFTANAFSEIACLRAKWNIQ